MKMQPKNIVSAPKNRRFADLAAKKRAFLPCFSPSRTMVQLNS
jgi:hypothetical protein